MLALKKQIDRVQCGYPWRFKYLLNAATTNILESGPMMLRGTSNNWVTVEVGWDFGGL